MRKLSLEIPHWKSLSKKKKQITKKRCKKEEIFLEEKSLEADEFENIINNFFQLKNHLVLKDPEIDINKQNQRIVFLLLVTAGFMALYASVWSMVLVLKNSSFSAQITINQDLTSPKGEYTGNLNLDGKDGWDLNKCTVNTHVGTVFLWGGGI